MRCHYLSDLHLESQAFDATLPNGDVLLVAGDLCHARCLGPARQDRYSIEQRDRVMRFLDQARARFAHVLVIAGNHEPYDGVLEDTMGLMRRQLDGIRVLDNEMVELEGTMVFGTTLWTDFEGRSPAAMDAVRRRMGEFFFVKTRRADGTLAKFRPEDALAAHDAAMAALRAAVATAAGKPMIVVTHHAPSRLGLNPRFAGNGLDGAYASNLDDVIGALGSIRVWVHGHTHIARTYRIGSTSVCSNALGFASKGQGARGFSVDASFTI
ncbi:MAG: metallophosphoesterase [Gammaproteobacteria bacterium]|nr:metallophosphoesterase [Gammaproteobacteria bacterium]